MIPYNEREVLKLLQEESTQRKGFEMIVAQYSEQLYWQIRRMVLSHEDANDLLQNTFIKHPTYRLGHTGSPPEAHGHLRTKHPRIP